MIMSVVIPSRFAAGRAENRLGTAAAPQPTGLGGDPGLIIDLPSGSLLTTLFHLEQPSIDLLVERLASAHHE